MIETFRRETFSEGDVVKVFYEEDKYVEMVLTKTYEGRHKVAFLEREPFAWIFRTEKNIFIEAGCYKMEQSKVGSFEMMINPVVPLVGQNEYNFYEAVFS